MSRAEQSNDPVGQFLEPGASAHEVTALQHAIQSFALRSTPSEFGVRSAEVAWLELERRLSATVPNGNTRTLGRAANDAAWDQLRLKWVGVLASVFVVGALGFGVAIERRYIAQQRVFEAKVSDIAWIAAAAPTVRGVLPELVMGVSEPRREAQLLAAELRALEARYEAYSVETHEAVLDFRAPPDLEVVLLARLRVAKALHGRSVGRLGAVIEGSPVRVRFVRDSSQ